MRYKVNIQAFGDADKIAKCFEAETEKKDRAGFAVKKQKDHAFIEVEAEDSVALRATLNSIAKLLNVYENISTVK